MYICYIDESGDTGVLPSAHSPVQPVLVLGGLILCQAAVPAVTRDYIDLKRRYFPGLAPTGNRPLHWILQEVKGADIRKQAALGTKPQRRHAIGFLHETLKLLERHQAKIVARVWVKGIGTAIRSAPIYTSSIQYVHRWFEHYLDQRGAPGWVIADSRTKQLNSNVSHSVFTEKYRFAGDKYPHVAELLTFGHSENHAGVQLADLICSALLFPMAVNAYCSSHLTSVHVRSQYKELRQRFGSRLKAMQHEGWTVGSTGGAAWRGGITVSDSLAQRNRSLLFHVS